MTPISFLLGITIDGNSGSSVLELGEQRSVVKRITSTTHMTRTLERINLPVLRDVQNQLGFFDNFPVRNMINNIFFKFFRTIILKFWMNFGFLEMILCFYKVIKVMASLTSINSHPVYRCTPWGCQTNVTYRNVISDVIKSEYFSTSSASNHFCRQVFNVIINLTVYEFDIYKVAPR